VKELEIGRVVRAHVQGVLVGAEEVVLRQTRLFARDLDRLLILTFAIQLLECARDAAKP
jgi:hypothetical protein